MVSELSTSGSGAVARIEVGNIGSQSLPFETRITRINFDPDGTLVETPADEDFLVFPPQGLVPTSGRQVVRVQWIGQPDIPSSQAYYVWIRQLPVETDPQKIEGTEASVKINVLYTMKSLIVVAPSGAKPRVEVKAVIPKTFTPPTPQIDPELQGEADAQPEAESLPGVEVSLVNTGNRYALMSGAKWVLTGTDIHGQPFEKTYDGEEISQIVGVGYLAPAGGTRTFSVPTGVELDPSKRIELRFTR
ncbi:MAG: molecular chaperone [Sphingomonadaceae bacterium]